MNEQPQKASPQKASQSKLTQFVQGVIAQLPLQLGVIPFGLVFGILALESGLSPAQSIAMSCILFGGASQVVFAQLFFVGTSSLVTGSSVAVINLRHVLYSAAIAKHLIGLPLKWRIILGYLLTDEAFALSIDRFKTHPQNAHYHLLGGGLTLWAFWQFSTIAGVLIGKEIPQEWNLDFAIPLTFIAIVLPNLRQTPHLAAAISAGAVAIIGQDLPHNLWIIAAALAGIIMGGLTSGFLANEQKA